MFVDERDIRNFDTNPIKKVGLSSEKSFMESIDDAWEETWFSGVSSSEQNNLHNAYEEYINELEKQTGERLDNPFRSAWGEFLVEDVIKGFGYELIHIPGTSRDNAPYNPKAKQKRDKENLASFYKDLDKLREEYPNIPYKTELDIHKGIMKKAEEWRQYNALGRDESAIGSFIGSTAALMSDPFNLTATVATAPFTGGTGGTLLATVGRAALVEGVVNAGVEAVQQVDVYKYQQKLGNEYTKTDAAIAVGMAGLGGAGLAAAGIGGKALLKKTVSKVKSLKNKGFKLKPHEEDCLAFAEERINLQDFIDRSSPYPESDIENIYFTERLIQEQKRLLQAEEAANLARAWDSVADATKDDFMTRNPHEILATITDDDMKQIVFERGEWSKATGGSSEAGYGMVKVRWKHGDLSGTVSARDTIPVMKKDITDLPEIIRDYEPMLKEEYGNRLHWSVRRSDGVQVLYAFAPDDLDKTARVITIHTIKPDSTSIWKDVISPKRKKNTAGVTSKSGGIQSSDKSALPVNDTAQKPYYRTNESLESSSARSLGFHDQNRVHVDNIADTMENVKDLQPAKSLSVDEIEKMFDDLDTILPDQEIDGLMRGKTVREFLEDIKKEDSYIDEISECIVEFGKK